MTRRTLLLPLLLTALCLLAGASTARAESGSNHAALVVRFADNSVETRLRRVQRTLHHRR